jgi:hypothetical protein
VTDPGFEPYIIFTVHDDDVVHAGSLTAMGKAEFNLLVKKEKVQGTRY